MTPPKEYSPGDTVFAKLKGYPWWPARVEDDKEIPAKILKQKGKSKAAFYTVFFYGSRDYGFFGPDCIRPFDRAAVERDLKAKKFKTKDLENAIHQALDPSLLKAEEEAEAAEEEEASEDEEEKEQMEEDQDELVEEEEEIKPKRKERKTPTPKKPTAAAAATNNTRKRTGNNKKATKDLSAKRARLDEESEEESKKKRKSLSPEQEEDTVTRKESPTTSRKSEEPANEDHPVSDLELYKKTPEYKKTYHSRHKLQKLMYEKRPGEIPKEDYQRISNVLKEVEETNMTFDLLRYTKIGKVMKYGCGYAFEDDKHNIKQRCVNLMRKWKTVLSPHLTEHQQKGAQQTNGHHS